MRDRVAQAPPALKFVVMVGIMSFFADFTYEGSRSIAGPYLGLLGTGAFTISVISGAGQFIGYNVPAIAPLRQEFADLDVDEETRSWDPHLPIRTIVQCTARLRACSAQGRGGLC